MSFQEFSREIVQEFLQTVVVVDDQARLSNDDRIGTLPENIPSSLQEPIYANSFDSEEDLGAITDVAENLHPLNAKALNDSFAEKGLVCAILRPGPDEVEISDSPSLENTNLIYGKTLQAAKRADLVILDWNIYGHYGEVTKQIISEIVQHDIAEERLRLIAIYTGEPDLENYIHQVAESLNGNSDIECLVAYKHEKFMLTCGPVKIIVLGKKDVLVGAVPEEYSNNFATVEELPGLLIDIFTNENMGLLSNVCLTSIASIRKKTHKLLGKFNPDLDAAYLTHRLLLKHPKESEQHLIPLITEEILAILQDNEVGKLANINEIQKWFEYKSCAIDFRSRADLGRNSTQCANTLTNLLNHGLNDRSLAGQLKKVQNYFTPLLDQNHKSYLTKLNALTDLFSSNGTHGEKIDSEFSRLTKLRTRYSSPLPRMTLGTIVKAYDNGIPTYYLCIQPRCDSVRVSSKGKSFLFLKMTTPPPGNRFDLIIEDSSNAIKLNYNIRSESIMTFFMKPPSGKDEINASEESGKFIFPAKIKIPGRTPHDYQLIWVADLKPDQAQLVANKVSAQLSRVGLNDYEWLRRQSE